MSIKLKRVELSNIRSHKHVIFEPEDEGITAISGPNGTGKSTIVDSIAWVLYGTKPQGVSKVSAIYREGAVFGEDRCFASVVMDVDGQVLKVERRMVNKGGAVECEVWEQVKSNSGQLKYKQIAGPAVSHAEPYIRKRLKMDEKGFLSAILVQQKQVDQLISSGPRERAAVIEKLTGISSITAALVESRQEYNSLKKVASISTIDEEGLKKLKTDRDELEKSIKSQETLTTDLKEKASTSKAEALELRDKVSEESEKIESVDNLRQELIAITTKIESHEEELVRLNDDRKAKRDKMSLVSSGTSLSEIEPKVNDLKSKLRSTELDAAKCDTTLRDSRKKLGEYEVLIESSDVKTLDEVDKAIETARTKQKEIVDEIGSTKAKGVSAGSEIEKLKKAINVLSEGDGSCPTCLQHVEDVSSAVGILQAQIDELSESKDNAKSHIRKLQAEAQELKSHVSELVDLQNAIVHSTELQETIETASTSIDSLNGEVKALEVELKAIERVYNEAKRYEETKNEYEKLRKRSITVSDAIEKLKGRKEEIEDVIKVSGTISAGALAKLRKRLEDARTTANDLAMQFSDARSDLRLSREQFNHIGEKIESYELEVKRYKDLLKSVEVAASSTNLIEEFREERIKNSIPVIEVYASDLISRFTEGTFTRLKLDGKFNTTVCLADGTERAVGLLSGGELSAASMALRLAISMLLNSGSATNLIILDEVLVSQDAGRAELILSTVREVCKGQVVLIAHNDSIDGIADKVVELDPK